MQITFKYYDTKYPDYLFEVVKEVLGLTPTFEHTNGTGSFSFGDSETDMPKLINCAALCDAIWYGTTFYRKWKIDNSYDYDSLNDIDKTLYESLFASYENGYYSLIWRKILLSEKKGGDKWLNKLNGGTKVRQINKEPFILPEKVCYIACNKYGCIVIFACSKTVFDTWIGRAEGDSGEVSSEFWTFMQENKDIARNSFDNWKNDCYDINAGDSCSEGDCTCKPFGYQGWNYGAYDLGELMEKFY